MNNINELEKIKEDNNQKIKQFQRGIKDKISLASIGKHSGNFNTWHNWVYFPSIIISLTLFICIPMIIFVGPDNDPSKWGWVILLTPIFIISSVSCILVRKNVNSIFKKNKEINSNIEVLRKENYEIDKKISDLERGQYNSKLELRLSEVVKQLDKDGNHTLDLVESEDSFMVLLKSQQNKILEFEKTEGKDFTNKFVKLSNFLKLKRAHLQNLFSQFKQIKSLEVLDNAENLIKREMYMYNLLLLDSLHMISSFIDDDRISFNIIYEKFDALNVWNTNFQNQMLNKLDLLNNNIDRLRGDISEMNHNSNMIIDKLEDLSHISQENSRVLDEQLRKINSSVKANNVLNAINTYQNYKTNQRLK
tara:strand:- start:241 stop:1329 length:1089 start_codon:yes stop_codon:yes gene_type:complete